jgi:hypothetical protein
MRERERQPVENPRSKEHTGMTGTQDPAEFVQRT